MNRYWETTQPGQPAGGRGPRQGSDDPAWADAEDAAEELRRELENSVNASDFVGFRVVRNVVGRPVVQLGTVDPDVARRLASLLRGTNASSRPFYVVKGGAQGASPSG